MVVPSCGKSTEATEVVNTDLTEEFLKQLADRGPSSNPFGYGIRTASDYVGDMVACIDDDMCRSVNFTGADGKQAVLNREEIFKAAKHTLTYANEEMRDGTTGVLTSSSDIKQYCKNKGVDLPPRTLMVFENVVTTPKKDRDGDILRTQGATVDPNMPLLWMHMPPMPIGKMLKVLSHNSKRLSVASAIMDSELGNNAAALIEFGALRISHGFRPTKFEMLSEKEQDETDFFPGFDIQEFEIMEESTVSVPSNTDAIITAFSRGKCTHPLVKTWAGTIFNARNKQVAVAAQIKSDGSVTVPVGKDRVTVETNKDGSTRVWVDSDDSDTSGVEKGDQNDAQGVSPAVSGVSGKKTTTSTQEEPPGDYGASTDKSTCGCGKAVSAMEVKGGRVLSKANETRIDKAVSSIQSATQDLDDVLAQVRKEPEPAEAISEPGKDVDVIELIELSARWFINGEFEKLEELKRALGVLLDVKTRADVAKKNEQLMERLTL